MARWESRRVKCSCGKHFMAATVASVDGSRNPDVRAEILNGTFHRAMCPTCHQNFTVERTFLYTDRARNQAFLVVPRNRRHNFAADDHQIGDIVERVGASTPDLSEAFAGSTQNRVVYGMAELREKLIIADAGLDDRVIELAKLGICGHHPFLLDLPRVRLSLVDANTSSLTFLVSSDITATAYRVVMDRAGANEIAKNRVNKIVPVLEQIKFPTFEGEGNRGHVEMYRHSTQPAALKAFMAIDVSNAQWLDTCTVKQIIDGLPNLARMPSFAKAKLQKIVEALENHGRSDVASEIIVRLTEIKIGEEFVTNTRKGDLAKLWQSLMRLPKFHLAALDSSIDTIDVSASVPGGEYVGKDITIGSELADNPAKAAQLSQALLHEIGHAVEEHRRKDGFISRWLVDTLGWQEFSFATYEESANSAERWAKAVGGWPLVLGVTPNKVTKKMKETTALLLYWIKGESDAPTGARPYVTTMSADWIGDTVVQQIYAKTVENWWEKPQDWHRIGDFYVFMNYYYHKLTIVRTDTIDRLMGPVGGLTTYAFMSPSEFFAEIYALNYDLDPARRAVLPADVKKFVDDIRLYQFRAAKELPRGSRRR